jgi:predicted hydrocarbon binding protein
MLHETDANTKSLMRSCKLLDAIVKSLGAVDLKTRKEIMESCGKACAQDDGDLTIAEEIGRTTENMTEVVERINKGLPWCGIWSLRGKTIESICTKCGCPLVKSRAIDRNATWCYCSRGWVKAVFEAALKRHVEVELNKSIGLGDEICRFVVRT